MNQKEKRKEKLGHEQPRNGQEQLRNDRAQPRNRIDCVYIFFKFRLSREL